MRKSCLLLALALMLPIVGGTGQAGGLAGLSDSQLSHIRSMGPWPPAFERDPGNRVSGNPQAIELGRRLFRDPRMSPIGYIGCVTCHQPDRAFTDLRARAHGIADLPRNTPTLANLRLQRWYGWGGASDSLWLASIRPMFDPREFDGTATSVTRIFERDPGMAACYRAVFGEAPQRDAEQTIVNVGKALAAFQETLVTGATPFDAFRAALLRGDTSAMSRYPPAARRGLALFVGSAGCAQCHNGPNFSDGQFHAVLPVLPRSFAGPDNGRLDGATQLLAHRLNLLGRYNDDASRSNSQATRALRPQAAMQGRFRTPSLRNVAFTGPYLHDGRADSLADALLHGPGGKPRPLRDTERKELVAFLQTLGDAHGARRPWSVEPLVACD